MNEIDDAMAPITEAEIKEHHAALLRQWSLSYHLCLVDCGGASPRRSGTRSDRCEFVHVFMTSFLAASSFARLSDHAAFVSLSVD
jgi:hypothetical protein